MFVGKIPSLLSVSATHEKGVNTLKEKPDRSHISQAPIVK